MEGTMADSRLIMTIAGLELYLFRDLRTSFPPHLHAEPLAGILLSGSRLFCYGSKQRLLKAGGAIVLPAFMPHSCQPATQARTDWLCLLLRQTEASNFEPVFTDDAPLASMLAKIGADLMQAQKPEEGDLFAIREIVLSLPEQSRATGARSSSGITERRRQHPAELDNPANLDKFQFLRTFRATNGLTPSRYHDSMRLLKARELLQKGIGLADCSVAAGYYDQSHFSRRFKSALGVTPGAYQHAWRAPLC